jgi:hypothetical protein
MQLVHNISGIVHMLPRWKQSESHLNTHPPLSLLISPAVEMIRIGEDLLSRQSSFDVPSVIFYSSFSLSLPPLRPSDMLVVYLRVFTISPPPLPPFSSVGSTAQS